MANLQNLKPFKKGNKASPGRPKGVRPMKSIIKEFLECEFDAKNIPPEFQNLKIKGKTMTVQQLMTLAQIKKALKGDEKAYDRIIDRFEGKPTQTVVTEDEEGNKKSINVNISIKDGD
jgi:hypothetical protein